jgi:hypothetical protein
MQRQELLRTIPLNDPAAGWRWRRLLCQTTPESEPQGYVTGLGDERRAVRNAAWLHVNALLIHRPAPATDPQWTRYRATADEITDEVQRRDLTFGLAVFGMVTP